MQNKHQVYCIGSLQGEVFSISVRITKKEMFGKILKRILEAYSLELIIKRIIIKTLYQLQILFFKNKNLTIYLKTYKSIH